MRDHLSGHNDEDEDHLKLDIERHLMKKRTNMVKNSHTNFINSCIKQISKDKDLKNKSTRDCKRNVLKDSSYIKQISKDKDLKNKSTRDCKRNVLKDQNTRA